MTIEVLAVMGQGVLPPETPVAAADDLGLTRGDGCFEGLRIRRTAAGAEVHFLDRHLARMDRSATALGIPFDHDAWVALVAELAGAWDGGGPSEGEASVRLILTRGRPGADGPTAYGMVLPLVPDAAERRRDGIDVATLSRGFSATSFKGAPWLLGGVKALSYAVNMAAQREATRRGAHEPLFVTEDGELLESATSSVVWTQGSTMHTVADGAGNGILHSITTEVALERAAQAGWSISTAPATVADLRAADVVALVSAGVGPVRVRSLDGEALEVATEADGLMGDLRAWTLFA